MEAFSISTILEIVILLGSGAFAWGKLNSKLEGLHKRMQEMVPELKDVRERLPVIEYRLNNSWKNEIAPASSPRMLNDKGEHILHESGMDKIIDENKQVLLDEVKEKDIDNPYDAEKSIHEVVDNLIDTHPDLEQDIKTGAFNTGQDLETVLFVGGLYLRDVIFEKELGFPLDASSEKAK